MLVTLTTVGYGDISPESWYGQLVSVLAIVCGVLFMAMPISIVGNEFTIAWSEREMLRVARGIQALLKERNMQPAEVALVFHEFDDDSEGCPGACLDLHEFRRALQVMGIKLSRSRLKRVFSTFDRNGDGYVEYIEFIEKVFPDMDEDMLLDWTAINKANYDDDDDADADADPDAAVAPGGYVGSGVDGSVDFEVDEPAPDKLPDEFTFEVGVRVRHPHRGPGVVAERLADGRTRVDFENGEQHRYKPAAMHKLSRDDERKKLRDTARLAVASMRQEQRQQESSTATGPADARLLAVETTVARLAEACGRMEQQLALNTKLLEGLRAMPPVET